MDKQTQEKESVIKSSDSNVTVQTISSNKTQMGNIMKKSRWDQPPSDEENSKDVSKISGNNSKLISEVRGHSSSTNVESGSSKGSVKEVAGKFEIISGSAKRNPALIKGHLSGIEQGTACEENSSNYNVGGIMKQTEEHLQRSRTDLGKDTADSRAEQILPKTTSRVKLVRTNFNVATQQESDLVKSINSKDEKTNSEDREKGEKTVSKDVHKRDLSLKEGSKDVKKGDKQDKDDDVEKDLVSAEAVITSTALQMISSYNDSPSEDSSSEPENISANEKLLDTPATGSFCIEQKENDERTVKQKFSQIRNKETNINDTAEKAVSDSKLHTVSNIVKDAKEEILIRMEENYECVAETSLKLQTSSSEPSFSTRGNEMEVSVESRNENDSLLYRENRESEFMTEDDKNSERMVVGSETGKLTVRKFERDKESSFKNDNVSKFALPVSENVEEIKETENELIEDEGNDARITVIKSEDLNCELYNVKKDDVTVTTNDNVKNSSSVVFELKDIQVELHSKSGKENIIFGSRDDSNTPRNESVDIQTEEVKKEINVREKSNIECGQAVNKIDSMTECSHFAGEENALKHIDAAEDKIKLRGAESLNEQEGSNEFDHTVLSKNQEGQSTENNKEEVNSKSSETCESLDVKGVDTLQNAIDAKENEEHSCTTRVHLSGETDSLKKVNEIVGEENLRTLDKSTGSGDQESSSVGEIFAAKEINILKDVQEYSSTENSQNVGDIQTDFESKLSDDMQKLNSQCVETYAEGENIITDTINSNYDLCSQGVFIKDTSTIGDNTTIQEPDCSEVTENLSNLKTDSTENESKQDFEICESRDSESISVPSIAQEENIQEGISSDTDYRKYEKCEINKQASIASCGNLMDSCEDNAVDGSSVFESVRSNSKESHVEISSNLMYKDTEYTSHNLSKELDINMDVSSIPLPDVCEDEKKCAATTVLVPSKDVNDTNINAKVLDGKSQNQEEKQASKVCVENTDQSSCAENKLDKDNDVVKSESTIVNVDVSSKCFMKEDVFCDIDMAMLSQATDETVNIQEKSADEGDSSEKALSDSTKCHSLSTVSPVEICYKDVESSEVVINSNDGSNCFSEIDLNIEDKVLEATEQNKIDVIVTDNFSNMYSRRNAEVSACSEITESLSELQSGEIDAQEKSGLNSQDAVVENLLEHIDETICSVSDNGENKTMEKNEFFGEQNLDDVENILCASEKFETSTKITTELISESERCQKDNCKVENSECINIKSLSVEEMDNTVEERETDTQDMCEIEKKTFEDFENKDREGGCETVSISNCQDVKQEVCETVCNNDVIESNNLHARDSDVESINDVRSSEFISTGNNRIHKNIQSISEANKNSEVVGEDTAKKEEDAVTENNTSDSKAEENAEFRHENVNVVRDTSSSLEYKLKTNEGKSSKDGVESDKTKSERNLSHKEKEILSEDSYSVDGLLENESRSKNNSDIPVLKSCSKELKTNDCDNFSSIAEHTLAKAENISVISVDKQDEIEIKKVPDKKTDEKQKCNIETNLTENVQNKHDSLLKSADFAHVSEENDDTKNEDLNVIKEQNEVFNLKATEIKKQSANMQEDTNNDNNSLAVNKTLMTEITNELDNNINERKVSSQNIPEKVELQEEAVNVENTATSKLDVEIKEAGRRKEGETDKHKSHNENKSSLESGNGNLKQLLQEEAVNVENTATSKLGVEIKEAGRRKEGETDKHKSHNENKSSLESGNGNLKQLLQEEAVNVENTATSKLGVEIKEAGRRKEGETDKHKSHNENKSSLESGNGNLKQLLQEEAVNVENTATSKLDVEIKEAGRRKEGETDKHKSHNEKKSSLESGNDNLIHREVTSEVVNKTSPVVSTSDTTKVERKALENTTNPVVPLNDKVSYSADNDEEIVTNDKVRKNDAQLPAVNKAVIDGSNTDTKIALKTVSLKRPQSLLDIVSMPPDSSSSKLVASTLKKQKLSGSMRREKEECLSKSMSSNLEILFSSVPSHLHGYEGRCNEETGNKEKVQSVAKQAVSSNSSSNLKGSTLESPLETTIYKALSDRKEVCITKVTQVHKSHKPEDMFGSSQMTDISSTVTSCGRSHLFTKDGKLFSSQDDVVKELPQVKLEPITLKLSRDSTSVTRASSVSPKKTTDTNLAVVRAESVSPKKTSDYIRGNDMPKSQLSPKTKTLGYTLKIGKDSTTIVPKESKLSPRVKEHSPGTSSSSLKNTDLSKVEHMLKETGVTITPVLSAETQESQKLSKITLKLSKAGGHPEIKQEKTETWKTVQKLTEVDIVPLQDPERTQSVMQHLKRKDNVESHIPEKKLKLSPPKELIGNSGPSLPEQSKLQGLLAKSHVLSSDSLHSLSSDGIQIVGVIPPKDTLSVHGKDSSSGSAEVAKTLESVTVKQEVIEIRPQPKKRGRPRKVVPVIPPPVHVKGESDPSGPMFPTPLFNLTDDAFGVGNSTGPPTLFPDQVQPGRRPKRACSGRIKLPVVRSRRPRGSGIVRGVTRGRGRGRGVKRKYDGSEFPGSSLTLDNLENQIDADGKVGTEGNGNSTIFSSPIRKNEAEDYNAGRTEIQKEVKIKPQRAKKEGRRLKREDKRAKKKSGSGSTPIVLPPPQMFEEETRMSASESNSRSQTPARAAGMDGMGEESQGSLVSTPGEQSSTVKENNRNKKGRMEVIDLESSKEFTVDQITEYQWPLQGGELWMIQEQISLFLGVKSFKRKYPEIKRRPVEPEERQYLCDNGLVSESMCDLGLTSVSSAEILDIMFQDFQDKYEDFRKHIREKQARELSNKQKSSEKKKGEQGPQKLDIKEQAIQSASSWNQSFNKSRLEHRRCALDLQTWTIQFPRNRLQKMTRPIPKLGAYPVAVIPGQFCDYYKSYTPQELRYFPLNTVLYGPMKPNERHHIGGSDGSQSESEESSSSDDSSDSSSDGEATCEEDEKDVKDVLTPVKSEQLKMMSCTPSVIISDKSAV